MDEDTHEFDPVTEDGAPWANPVNRHDDDPVDTGIETPEPKVPEPALVRGAVAAVIGLIGYILGKQIDGVVVDQIMDIYAVAAPLALAWWIRSRVTPVKK